jgi:hypothetical protein
MKVRIDTHLGDIEATVIISHVRKDEIIDVINAIQREKIKSVFDKVFNL